VTLFFTTAACIKAIFVQKQRPVFDHLTHLIWVPRDFIMYPKL